MPVHPQVRAWAERLRQMGARPIFDLDPKEARKADLESSLPFMSSPEPVGRIRDEKVPGPAGEIRVRIYWPRGEGNHPLLVYFHGGGWVVGDLNMVDETCCMLTNGSGSVVVSVDYRLAPEHRFPAAPEDCYAATRWAAENAGRLGADVGRLVVCGDSAGGNLAAVMSIMSRDRHGPEVAHQALVYPVTDLTRDMSKYSKAEFGPSKAEMEWYGRNYLADASEASNPLASPILADLARLPPATVVTAEHDPLTEQCNDYAAKLSEAGVRTKVINYPGLIHGFFTLPSYFEAGRDAIAKVSEEVRRL